MRVLVTNDDGVHSVGIHVLAAALSEAGHDVLVVAPAREQSGTGAALGRMGPDGDLDAVRVALPGAPGVEAWALDGPPAMCVLSARLGGFGERPDIVVSGINAGLNTGRSILHSGTVGAVLTGQNFGMSGLAVSSQSGDVWQWACAAALAVEVLPLLLDGPPRAALNLNVPCLPRGQVRGIRWARLAPFGEVRVAMVGSDHAEQTAPGDPPHPVDPIEQLGRPTSGGHDTEALPVVGASRRRLRMELQLTEQAVEPDTDTGLVRAGWAALTTLVGPVEAWPGDRALDRDDVPTAIDERVVPGAPLHRAHRVPDASADAVLRRPVIGS